MLNMADGCLLLIDAVEGPMPQTRFVLRKALRDRPAADRRHQQDRPPQRAIRREVLNLTQDLFLDLATDAEQLDFPVLYANRQRGPRRARPRRRSADDLQPLFDAIVRARPGAGGDPEAPLQMLVTTLDYDDYRGKIAIGRIFGPDAARATRSR